MKFKKIDTKNFKMDDKFIVNEGMESETGMQYIGIREGLMCFGFTYKNANDTDNPKMGFQYDKKDNQVYMGISSYMHEYYELNYK